MSVWNKPPEEEPKKIPQTTKEQADLLRAKIEIEDELKNDPESTATKLFYDQMTKPFKQPNEIEKETDEPP
ncbi:hypothetical protein I6N96_07710 [Enterococcus sp. BWM-S5]|uniref:Uncharacterized protein n=1 Tax=Enterococcus larvae TaxID=2794352 RepID=A0ABS4CJ69_9ENTE|nr:hypothetical protein [Enterococcus larvae]MBP1046166.1 hypothetical protein [Enterococcus larvae]